MAAAPPPPTEAQQEADVRLSKLLLGLSREKQIDFCLDLDLKPPQNPDPELRDAAVRRLDAMDGRNILERIGPRLRSAPSSERVALIRMLGDLFHRLGGIDPSANALLVEQIRSNDPAAAKEAIKVATEVRIEDAYIPLREIASRPGSPLRAEAIAGIVRLGDPRALPFLTKLLDEDAAPRDEIYQGLGAIGRPSALFLKAKILDEDPAERARALGALLPMVSVVDLSALYLYIERYPPEGELKTRLYATIARLEAAMAANEPGH